MSRTTKLTLLLTALLLTKAVLADAQQPAPEGGKKELLLATPQTFTPIAQRIFWRQQIKEPGSRFLRVRFANIVDASSTDYRLVIRDFNDQVRFEYSKADFSRQRSLWTGLVDGDVITVEIRGDTPPAGLAFTLQEYVFQAPRPALLSITGPNNLTPIVRAGLTSPVYRAGRAVAKLSFVTADGPAACTGFLVGDSVLLTNEHCVKSQEECETTVALFGYEANASGGIIEGERIACRRWIKSDSDLDVSVLQLDGTPGVRWGRLALDRRDVLQNEPLLIIQHPAGEPKQISQTDCRVSTPVAPGRAAQSDFGHLCDTKGGSSGSPVLDAMQKVVGLHHFGFSTDRWAAENRAVRMRLILDALQGILP